MPGEGSPSMTRSASSEVRLSPKACADLVDVLHAIRVSGGGTLADDYTEWFDREIRELAEDNPWLWEQEDSDLGPGMYRVHVIQHVMYVRKRDEIILVTHIGHQSSDIDIMLSGRCACSSKPVPNPCVNPPHPRRQTERV